jgi:pantetheine-phosphate adenylyltransferase
MMTGEDYFYISSQLVREVARFGGNVKSMVPANVFAKLQSLFPKLRGGKE